MELDRETLQEISRAALDISYRVGKPLAICAYRRLASAADALDALLARRGVSCEEIDNELGSPEAKWRRGEDC